MFGSTRTWKLLLLSVITSLGRPDSCNNKPTPFMLGATDGNTFFTCSAMVNSSKLLLGGKTSSDVLASLGTAFVPIFLMVDLLSHLEYADIEKQIVSNGLYS